MSEDHRAEIRRFLRGISAEHQEDLFVRYGILQRCHQLDMSIPPQSSETLVEYLLEACRGDRLTKREFPNLVSFPADLQSCREFLRSQQHIQPNDTRRRHRSSSAGFELLPVEDSSPPSHVPDASVRRYRCDSVTLGRDSHRPVRANAYDQQGISHISCGVHHTLVVTEDGRLWASGDHNGSGRLGTGDELPHPTPVVIMGCDVVCSAAGDTHSLALTKAGVVYAFGSNRFGQVGTTSPSLKPRKVDLKVRITAIAAGGRHSVALCEDGFVYGWGDNSAGQLGSAILRNSNRKVHRIESLHEIISIAAADQSTLALTARHTVYAWGHGNPVPTKVVIAATITAISAAKHHNVALANDGSVYAWGLHGDSLGSAQRSRTRVQRVELPEPAVVIAATEHHTAVISAQGHLYTFGDASDANILGHAGVRWQPEPKQVPGVYRAVGVAAAKEHMAIMICTTVPPVATAKSMTLADLAARKLAQQVDLFNAVSILIVAERTQSEYLLSYCHDFVQRNLDGILNVTQKSVMHTYLQEQLLHAQPQGDEDTLTKIIMAGTRPGRSFCTLNEWIEAVKHLVGADAAIQEIWKQHGGSTGLTSTEAKGAACLEVEGKRCRKESFAERSNIDLDDLVICTKELATDTLTMLNKEARAIRKRLGQIEKLKGIESRTEDQERKMARKPQLESDLGALGPAILRVEEKIRSFVLLEDEEEEIRETNDSGIDGKDVVDVTLNEERKEHSATIQQNESIGIDQLTGTEQRVEPATYFCSTCNVPCPDSASYYRHIDGRKHRNKIAQTAREEEDIATASLLESQRLKAFQNQETLCCENPKIAVSVWKKQSARSTPFKLPPPPHPVMEVVQKQSPKLAKSSPSSTRTICASSPTPSNADVVYSSKPKSLPTKPPQLSPMKSPPWASASIASLSGHDNAKRSLLSIMQEESKFDKSKLHTKSQAQPKIKLASGAGTTLTEPPRNSLSAFLPSPTQKPVSTKCWGVPIPSAPAEEVTKSSSFSFKEIQEQEEVFRTKQDHSYANNGQWFVERRERANSFKEIQKSAEAERKEQEVIEEQKRIEAQIYAEIQAKKDEQEKARKNKQKKRARKKAALKKQRSSEKNNAE